MTEDEDLLCRPWNRDVFVVWHSGEITHDEAVYFVRRVEFHYLVRWLPEPMIRLLLWAYDLILEPSHGGEGEAE